MKVDRKLLGKVALLAVVTVGAVEPSMAAVSAEAQAAFDAITGEITDILKQYWVPLGIILGITIGMKFTKRGAKAL